MREGILDQVRSILGGVLKLDISKIGHDFSSENIERRDSLAHMNLIVGLEEEFEIRFDDDIIDQLTSVEMIESHVGKILVNRAPNEKLE